MNKVFLKGNVVRDVELKKTANEKAVCAFPIAVNRKYKDKDGNQIADFFNVVAWNGLAETCAKYLHKGASINVVGELQSRSYDAADGSGKRYVTEIIISEIDFLSSKRPLETAQSGRSVETAENQSIVASEVPIPDFVPDDEDLPF